MKLLQSGLIVAQFLFILLCILPQPAMAYVGPGSGLTALGSLLAVVAAIFLSVMGFIWYPIKRMLRKKRPTDGGPSESGE